MSPTPEPGPGRVKVCKSRSGVEVYEWQLTPNGGGAGTIDRSPHLGERLPGIRYATYQLPATPCRQRQKVASESQKA